ncbi:hypothetical protein DH2020_043300 [Rehmannia glutinosa]|uniref:Zinc finger BED domain-containing protein RICESLEEPER 2-like n=1 Tax=Rehmannia glutinosa TaxID=99300 RepID=A0ABR0UKZ4_REHGL
MHEKPFSVVEDYGFTFMFKINLLQFEKVSHPTSKNDVISVCDIEKKKLQLILRSINKISLTTDIWKSKVQKISYMSDTGHFVDSNWELQKRVLSFMLLPPPHAGVDNFDGLMKCTKDWGIEHKIFTISVDNASNNDVAIQIAKETFSTSRMLPLAGKLFHVRCIAHILNLVVQYGLYTIKYIIEDVKDSVRFINQSESRLMKFSDIGHHLGIPVKKLIIDRPTRWNSTYEILEDWNKVEDVIAILEVFYDVTHVISGTEYPTSNVFLAVIWRVKYVLDEKENHPSEFIKAMIKKMKQKFDKYWGDCNILMAIGAILDPRFKMRLVDFAFNKIYNEFDARTNVKKVRDALYDMFFEYVQVDRMKTQKDSSSMSDKDIPISTVASEATFSAGTLVLDPYLAKLSFDMDQVLICGADWLCHLHGIKKPIMTYEEEEQINV